jgi:hypothetical protein
MVMNFSENLNILLICSKHDKIMYFVNAPIKTEILMLRERRIITLIIQLKFSTRGINLKISVSPAVLFVNFSSIYPLSKEMPFALKKFSCKLDEWCFTSNTENCIAFLHKNRETLKELKLHLSLYFNNLSGLINLVDLKVLEFLESLRA